MKNSNTFLFIILGLLAAMATVVNNLFAPSMPSLVESFGSTEAMVQSGFAAGMVGLSLGTLVWGVLSDALGRRRPLLVSMTLFVVCTACILPVKSLGLFVALRFVQGFTAAGGIAISRSVATDSFSDRHLLRAMAVINVVNGVMPIVTPLVGNAMVSLAGWQGVFAVMLAVGVVLMGGCLRLEESLPASQRSNRSFRAVIDRFIAVLGNRRFVTMLLHQATAEVLLFGNLASAAFIAQRYGYAQYIGLIYAVNGVCIGIGAGVAAAFPSARIGVRTSCLGMLVMSCVVAAVLVSEVGFIPYEIAVSVMLAFMGITLTSSSAIAMASAREQAGTASALFVAGGFMVSGLVTPLMGQGNMLHSTAATFVVGAVLATTFFLIHHHKEKL